MEPQEFKDRSARASKAQCDLGGIQGPWQVLEPAVQHFKV
jgi:hypothetical protein